MGEFPVAVTIVGHVGVVELDDPDHRNILTPAMVGGIGDAFDRLEDTDEISCVVLTGRGRAFCAGAELSTLERSAAGDFASVTQVYDGFLRVLRCPLPTIAAVNGAAVGAGFNLALACDLRLAAAGARFDTRFAALRLHPGGGHTWLLERAVGYQQAVLATLFGEVWDADRARAVGLVARVCEPERLLPDAVALASGLAGLDPAFVRRLVATLRLARESSDHATVLATETEAQAWSVGEPDFAATVRALREAIRRR